MDLSSAPQTTKSFPVLVKIALEQRWQGVLDSLSPNTTVRWIVLVLSVIIYCVRVYYLQGFYIVTYGLGIFLLNLLIGFLTPLDEADLNNDEGSGLPTSSRVDDDEYRPFVRRLPEFKFWYACMKAIFVAFCATFISLFNVPVFWPILLIYFIVLFMLMMKKQINHMIKYKYIPCKWGKKSHGKSEVRRVV